MQSSVTFSGVELSRKLVATIEKPRRSRSLGRRQSMFPKTVASDERTTSNKPLESISQPRRNYPFIASHLCGIEHCLVPLLAAFSLVLVNKGRRYDGSVIENPPAE
ncbi:hypothetical protein M413DRAFT_326389 [Hebeloma cylindrosporum]|uniref:Uncharacterized protein n=1 Tax=Hebeloma cylindrosporum TaxID=76867 RepID=A0A0C2Y3Z9_HEBCY|nr:hypothetical protein M413DRAFT_326389 [Hebeloma cylindrosporum h7]